MISGATISPACSLRRQFTPVGVVHQVVVVECSRFRCNPEVWCTSKSRDDLRECLTSHGFRHAVPWQLVVHPHDAGALSLLRWLLGDGICSSLRVCYGFLPDWGSLVHEYHLATTARTDVACPAVAFTLKTLRVCVPESRMRLCGNTLGGIFEATILRQCSCSRKLSMHCFG